MSALIYERYAKSLYDVGSDMNKESQFKDELDKVKSICASDERILKLLKHPHISKEEKKSFITELFEAQVGREILNFIKILIDKRRCKFLLEIIDTYNNIFNEENDIIQAEITTAIFMTEEQKEALKQKLEKKYSKKVEIINRIDENIIGGVLLRIDDSILDNTIKGELKSMELHILKTPKKEE